MAKRNRSLILAAQHEIKNLPFILPYNNKKLSHYDKCFPGFLIGHHGHFLVYKQPGCAVDPGACDSMSADCVAHGPHTQQVHASRTISMAARWMSPADGAPCYEWKRSSGLPQEAVKEIQWLVFTEAG